MRLNRLLSVSALVMSATALILVIVLSRAPSGPPISAATAERLSSASYAVSPLVRPTTARLPTRQVITIRAPTPTYPRVEHPLPAALPDRPEKYPFSGGLYLEGFVFVNGLEADDGTLVEAQPRGASYLYKARTMTVDGIKGYYLLDMWFLEEPCKGKPISLFVEGIEANESPVVFPRRIERTDNGTPFVGQKANLRVDLTVSLAAPLR